MIRPLLLLALCLGLCMSVTAQPKVALSQPFDEPESGWNKVMQLKNGNTFYFHFTKKDGIEVTVYDKSHAVISQKTLTSDLWDPRRMRESVVEGLYEINGQPVVFLHQMTDRTPRLYRLRLDANTGDIVKEKELGELERYGKGAAWAIAYGGVNASDFFIEKDPASDCYAVVYFNGFAKESGKRIEVVHYSGEHKILSRSYYFDSTAEAPFKYVRFIGMTVQGTKQVCVATYGFNTKNSGGKDSRVIISRMRSGEKTFQHNMLDFSDDFQDTKAIMQYNPGTNMIQLLTLTYIQTKSKFFSSTRNNYYLTLMTYIDPEQLTVAFTKPVLTEKVSEYAASHYNYDKGYSGMPQNMIINEDHSTTMLMEEIMTQYTKNQYGQVVNVQTFLNGIGISELSDRGAEQAGYAIAKSQMATGELPPLFHAYKGKGMWSYRGGGLMIGSSNNAFMSYDYVDAPKGRYIIFNDYPSNLERGEANRKRRTVTSISDANTVCFRIEKDEARPWFPFGEQDGGKKSNFSYIESSHFLPQTHTYATLMIERNGRDKKAHIAWVNFE